MVSKITAASRYCKMLLGTLWEQGLCNECYDITSITSILMTFRSLIYHNISSRNTLGAGVGIACEFVFGIWNCKMLLGTLWERGLRNEC